MRFYFKWVVLAEVFCVGQIWAQSSLVQSMTSQQLIRTGRESFVNRCSGCHGINADGKGPAMPMLSPRPRNLVAGSFKFRSTPSGTLPTSQDLLRTLNQGVLGTSMPSFRDLPESEKLALITYIRSLRPDFQETLKDQRSVALPSPPAEKFGSKQTLLASAAAGRKLYEQACLTCHGDKGLGDGPSIEGLMDGEEQPIKPANLSARQIKGGKTARDIFRAITTGLDGTPMPSFQEIFDEPSRWDLVAYVFYLRGRAAGIYTEKDELK